MKSVKSIGRQQEGLRREAFFKVDPKCTGLVSMQQVMQVCERCGRCGDAAGEGRRGRP